MRILITGGAGTLGRELTRQILQAEPDCTVVIYSRDEGKQSAMEAEIPEGGPRGARYMLGDINDVSRLSFAMRGVDTVYHLAALKMIDKCEYDAWEAYRVNVQGTINVAKSCIAAGVRRALFTSTDKAVDPIGVYGKAKAFAETAWVLSNTYGPTEFFATRYGNVVGSAKSVFHKWAALAEAGGPLPVTDPDATRFYWEVGEAAAFVRTVAWLAERGEIWIPKMVSYRMGAIAESYGVPMVTTGFRCSEKMHEVLWTDEESRNVHETTDRGCPWIDAYVLSPRTHPWRTDKASWEREEAPKPLSSKDCVCKEIPSFLRAPARQTPIATVSQPA